MNQLAYLRIRVLGPTTDPLGRPATQVVIVNRLGLPIDECVHYVQDKAIVQPKELKR